MPPRGRPRKPGRSTVTIEHMRMMGFDPVGIARELKTLLKAGRSTVATEHMRMMGFDPIDIARELKALLKTYGEDGWLFIESDAYNVLVEALLDAQERKRNNHGNEDFLEGEPVDKNVTTVLEAADARPSHHRPLSSSFLNAMAEQSEADIQAEGAGSGGGLSSPSPISSPHRRRKSCYGWICDDDEEEDEIITLNPAISGTFVDSTSEIEQESKRKTRWDVAPDVFTN